MNGRFAPMRPVSDRVDPDAHQQGLTMRQETFQSSPDSTSGRKRHSALVVGGGLLVLAILAAAIVDLPSGSTFTSHDPTEIGGVTSSVGSTDQVLAPPANAATPRFERTNEPAVEDAVNAHGG
jgi:hypothetical protein